MNPLELTEKIEDLKYLLTTASDLVARGELKRADDLFFKIKQDLQVVYYDVWLKHHSEDLK